MDWFIAFLMLSHWPYRLAMLSASATVILLMLLMIANNGQAQVTHMELAAEVAVMVGLGALIIFVARPTVFTRRIWFVLFLIGVLLTISELSKFGLSLTPPNA